MKNGKTMLMFAVLLAIASSATSAAEFGTRDQAKAMLNRAVAMLEADKGRALDLFTSGHGGFMNKDLYVLDFPRSSGQLRAMITSLAVIGPG